ncbi:hypothetical protein [Zoogloea sp.]|jgi:hypothetical protein|uniref:hypothetical protein n=1 Tax=Zoogloea sp. TaxID=49181 RepID=UPI0035AF53AD
MRRLPLFVIVFATLLAAAPTRAGGVEAYCPSLKWVLLAPPGGSAVQVIDVSRGVTPLATLRSRPRGAVLAVHVQAASRRVWVLADNGLDAHDGFSGRVLGHWAAPEGVRLDRLEADAVGRLTAWSGARPFEAVHGAAVLVPAGARVSWR